MSAPSAPPDDAALARLLGAAKRPWDELLRFVDEKCPGAAREWKFYGAKHGWQVRVVARKRALLYLIPREGRFTAAVALRETAIAALRADRAVPAALLRELDAARAAPEGKPARVEVTRRADLALVERLVAAKLS